MPRVSAVKRRELLVATIDGSGGSISLKLVAGMQWSLLGNSKTMPLGFDAREILL